MVSFPWFLPTLLHGLFWKIFEEFLAESFHIYCSKITYTISLEISSRSISKNSSTRASKNYSTYIVQEFVREFRNYYKDSFRNYSVFLKISLEIPSKHHYGILPSICPRIPSPRKVSTNFLQNKSMHFFRYSFMNFPKKSYENFLLKLYQKFLIIFFLGICFKKIIGSFCRDFFRIFNIVLKKLFQRSFIISFSGFFRNSS